MRISDWSSDVCSSDLELPKPGTQLSWGNAIVISPSLADSLKLRNGDEVELRMGHGEAIGPVWISSVHAARSVTVLLGPGRRPAGRIGNGGGFDANVLRGPIGRASCRDSGCRSV